MRPKLTLTLIFACLELGACSNSYFERKDTVTFSAGDAVASNIAVQVPDPWPRGSENTNIPMDPVMAQCAIQHYRQRSGVPPASPPPTGGSFFNVISSTPANGAQGGASACQDIGSVSGAPSGRMY